MVDNGFMLPKLITDKVIEIYQTWFPPSARVFSNCWNEEKRRVFFPRIIMTIWIWYSFELEYSQPLVDNGGILLNLINDKVLNFYQTWFPSLLESFLTVQIEKKKEFNPRIITTIWNWYSYEIEQPQPLVDNDIILPQFITDKMIGIYQT